MSITIPPRSAWSIPDDVTYLNHGSFGPAARVVQESREQWSRRLESQPMDFYLRQMDAALDEAMVPLAKLIRAEPRDLAFVDNATVAMNVVAENLGLQPGDEVLLNDHEYGAVFRIWRRVCERVGAQVVTARLGKGWAEQNGSPAPLPDAGHIEQIADVVEPIFRAVTDKTRLIVVSHVTSPTATVLPVDEICRKARERQIPVCIDGPHAIAMRDVDLKEIDCDYYCASLHKWLSAPCGSGFLYVKRSRQQKLQPHMTSWGRSLGGREERWQDQLNWLGTRDPAPFLAVPAAIEFLQQTGLPEFRQHTHDMAQVARHKLEQLFQCKARIPDSIDWYGSMIAVPMPPSDYKRPKPNTMHRLQKELWDRSRIEVPIAECSGQSFLRVSCHLYNTLEQIDYLIKSLEQMRSLW